MFEVEIHAQDRHHQQQQAASDGCHVAHRRQRTARISGGDEAALNDQQRPAELHDAQERHKRQHAQANAQQPQDERQQPEQDAPAAPPCAGNAIGKA